MSNYTLIIDFPLHLSEGHSILYNKKSFLLHIKEAKIESLIINPESLSEKEIKRIQAHMKNCLYCKDIYNTYLKMYKKIEYEINKKPTSKDKMIAKSIFNDLLENPIKKSQRKK